MTEKKTPQMDELEKGQWPSFVTEIKRAAVKNEASKELLHLLERSYEDKVGHWKHGGIVGVRGYGGGVIGRYSDLPKEFPNLAHFHTVRINSPSAYFYKTDTLRTWCDIWERRGSGLMNLHGATGDAILLGTTSDQLQPIYDELSDAGYDLGGSGSCLRSPSCCVGPARCEHSCYDTLDALYNITNEFQDELHRPMWPYKAKIKFSGCANDCAAAIARADFAVIGTWKGDIQIDAEAVKAYAEAGMDIQADVINLCPTKCISFDSASKELTIVNSECNRCMHCINKMTKALKPGKERGASILVGGKSTIVQSAFMGWVIIPFMKMEEENDYEEFKDLCRRMWEWWDENGKTRERIGETIYRLGMSNFLTSCEIEAVPQMVYRPRANPYVFWPEGSIIE